MSKRPHWDCVGSGDPPHKASDKPLVTSAYPAGVWVLLQMLEQEGAASLFGLKRRNYFLKDTFTKALI